MEAAERKANQVPKDIEGLYNSRQVRSKLIQVETAIRQLRTCEANFAFPTTITIESIDPETEDWITLTRAEAKMTIRSMILGAGRPLSRGQIQADLVLSRLALRSINQKQYLIHILCDYKDVFINFAKLGYWVVDVPLDPTAIKAPTNVRNVELNHDRGIVSEAPRQPSPAWRPKSQAACASARSAVDGATLASLSFFRPR